ncbi:MAG: ATP-binding protein [Hyphomonadaceae bacterium]|nr:ATP-binding protein [Hyphomonadaceae bacterium]MBX3511341.1 ATP-binding protein [Hyphomonadaceae bacterium]
MRLRNIAPKGLYWRTILIILVPAALLQIIITLIFLDDHWQATSKRMSQNVAADVALLINLYERNPSPETLADIEGLARIVRLQVELLPGAPLETQRCRSGGFPLDRYVWRPLEESIGREVFYDSTCPGQFVIIRVPVQAGVMEVRAFRDRVIARSGPLFVAWITGATFLICVVSVVFIRNQVRPIEKLADAMERFGRGDDSGGVFRVRGAREVRGATHAFFDMRARVRRLIDQRSQILAGVSHDLRTPLTRLKLQLALMEPTAEIEDAKRDLAEMEETLEEYLAFAKGIAEEKPGVVDLAALSQAVAADSARAGVDIAVEAQGPCPTPGRPRALKRCLANLIDNAAAHGEKVRVSVKGESDAVTVSIDDNGPGIPEELYEEAFRPFSRLDETRSRNQKGVGLGLAIARDVARSHGGDIALSQGPLGGLRATLRLPRPA